MFCINPALLLDDAGNIRLRNCTIIKEERKTYVRIRGLSVTKTKQLVKRVWCPWHDI